MLESTHASPRCPLPESSATVVRLRLNTGQAQELAQLATGAAGRHENVIFFALTVPFWSPQDNSLVWELQATFIPARIGANIKKLIEKEAARA
jgi:hypothetical protein